MGPRTATREEPGVHEFINSSHLPLERLKAMVTFFLNNQELIRIVLGLTPEDQERFVHRVDQVRRSRWLSVQHLPSLLSQRFSLLLVRKVWGS